MRGSPLIRFFLLALALGGAAVGLARVTSSGGGPVPAQPPTRAVKPQQRKDLVPFRLVLSAPATEVILSGGNQIHTAAEEGGVSGTLEIDPANPNVSLTVRWKKAPSDGEHRFAKLTLEAPGRETLTHVFDADGDIDDFLEIPIAQ